MSDLAIETHDLVKTFGRFRALDGLDLSVASGQVHGYLGPNGAGKSTTLRILLGLLRADGGSVRLLGGDPWREAPQLHRRLAYVPGDVALWPTLTGGEAIDLLGRMRGGLDRGRRDDLVAAFDLDVRKKGRTYSKGNRQKVALVAALASDAELLLLDEPTSGLDPLMERVFTDHVRELRAQGRTVLLSSHILSEVEELCDRVSIIKAGRVVESGSLDDLRHLHRLEVSADVDQVPAELTGLPGLHDLRVTGQHLQVHVESSAMAPLLALLARHGVRNLTSTPPSLEELFLSHYEATPSEPPNGGRQDSQLVGGAHRPRHAEVDR